MTKQAMNVEKSANRLYWIDTLKAIGIFFVLIGHKLENGFVVYYIYAFHVPLFFFISGYLCNYHKYLDFKGFLAHKARTLLIPYFCFAITSYLFWLVVVRSLSVRGQSLAINPIKLLAGIFFASGIPDWEIPLNVALWFIPCLLVTETLFWIFRILLKRGLLLYLSGLIFMGGIGFLSSKIMHTRLPWSIDVAFSASVFFGVGHLLSNRSISVSVLSSLPIKKKGFLVILSLILFVVHARIAQLNGQADMYANYYGNILYFYAAALSAIGFYLILSLWIPANRVSTYVGGNTMIIIGLSGNSLFVIYGLVYLVNKQLGASHSLPLWLAGLYSILQVAILFPVIYLINKHLPFMLGRKNERNHNSATATSVR